jgi:hypothetical protein
MTTMFKLTFIFASMLLLNIFSQTSQFNLQRAIDDCLLSDEVHKHMLTHIDIDSALVNIYGFNYQGSLVHIDHGNTNVLKICVNEHKFDNESLYLSSEELLNKMCFTQNQLDCTISYLDDKKIEIAILYRCNATIIRTLYKQRGERLKFCSRKVYRY